MMDGKEFREIAERTEGYINRLLAMTPEEMAEANERHAEYMASCPKPEIRYGPDSGEDEGLRAKREAARRRREEIEREYAEKAERKRKAFTEDCMKNLGYCPEPEPYREELVRSMEWNAEDGCKEIRKDLEPQDTSVGLKLVRVGSYRAGEENSRWDGRFRNWHRNYDVEGDYYLEFDDGSRLEAFHVPNCCEDNYADFLHMQVMGEQEGNSVDARDLTFFPDILNSIIPIKDLGFYIVTVEGKCILVSCYSKQNGYYSTDLTLVHGKRCIDLGGDCVRFKDDDDDD